MLTHLRFLVQSFKGNREINNKFDNETIHIAVGEWNTNKYEAELIYGPISEWDTSNVTNLNVIIGVICGVGGTILVGGLMLLLRDLFVTKSLISSSAYISYPPPNNNNTENDSNPSAIEMHSDVIPPTSSLNNNTDNGNANRTEAGTITNNISPFHVGKTKRLEVV